MAGVVPKRPRAEAAPPRNERAGASPSMLGLSPVTMPVDEGPEFPSAMPLSGSQFEKISGPGKVPQAAPVPEAPPKPTANVLIGGTTLIAPNEAYSKDEKLLNDFLKLHPMLSGFVHAQNSNPPSHTRS